MSWNYRIILHAHDNGPYFGLHEVYYDDDGKPNGWTENPISFTCCEREGPAGIHQSLAMALNDALRLPVLVERGDKLEEQEEKSNVSGNKIPDDHRPG